MRLKRRKRAARSIVVMNTPTSLFTPALARLVATVSVGFVVTQLDVTIVNVALAKIGTDLHASVAGLQWIVDAYTLAFAVLMLSAGVLGDRYGARRVFACGIALFALASLLCGLAGDAALLVAARACQGIGAAAMLPSPTATMAAMPTPTRAAESKRNFIQRR